MTEVAKSHPAAIKVNKPTIRQQRQPTYSVWCDAGAVVEAAINHVIDALAANLPPATFAHHGVPVVHLISTECSVGVIDVQQRTMIAQINRLVGISRLQQLKQVIT